MKSFRSFSGAELDRLLDGQAPDPGSGLEEVAGLINRVQQTYLGDLDADLEASQLTGLLRTVHLTDKGDLAARSASKVHGPGSQVSGLPTRRRKFMLETLLGSIGAKLAAAGVAVALTSTGAVAATGHLPDEMQTGISQAVDKVGISIPLGATAEAEAEALEQQIEAEFDAEANLDALDGEETVGEETDGEETDGEGDDDAGPNENAAFGQSVAADARGDSDGEKGVDGQEISRRAHERNEQRKADRQSGSTDGADDDAGNDDDDSGDSIESNAVTPGDTAPGKSGERGNGNGRR